MNTEMVGTQGTDVWTSNGPYEFVHPTGWTITNYIIRSKSVWKLKNGSTEQGSYKSAEEAKRQHAAISAA